MKALDSVVAKKETFGYLLAENIKNDPNSIQLIQSDKHFVLLAKYTSTRRQDQSCELIITLF